MFGELEDWQDTRLWAVLKDNDHPEAAAVEAMLRLEMPAIQSVLTQGGTSPTDFTLHDSQHSFRVAQRMAELIPEVVLHKLSVYEVAFLLLSAYLHDIGMTPEQDRIQQLRDYMLIGNDSSLQENELEDFLQWLDGEKPDLELPITINEHGQSAVRRTNYIVGRYCRYRHVDWGENWIEHNLRDKQMGTYRQWISDLKALCRSHGQGFSELIGGRFDAKPVGSNSTVVHLRYLAAILRLADVLEFDAERTPEIVYRHRSIDPGSEIYWHRDHHVSLYFDGKQFTLSAEPPDARIHHATEELADQIQSELLLVRRLNDSRRFSSASFQQHPLPHTLDLNPDLRRTIRPRDNTYEYIEGTFRPNTEKLLKLLAGTQLYRSELVAVRELLQNAMDAVREQIAYERLTKVDPEDPEWEARLGATHEIKLSLQRDQDNRVWLVCSDDGVGMSKKIISDYVLVSGNSAHPSVRRLERKSRAAGFEVGRTGQFGIGVLSYFMVSDRVEICTSRSNLTGDRDNETWCFETDGVGEFGELRRSSRARTGTEVRLRLRSDVINEVVGRRLHRELLKQWQDESQLDKLTSIIVDYLEAILTHTPCKVRFEGLPASSQPNRVIHFEQGWARDKQRLTNDLIDLVERHGQRSVLSPFSEAVQQSVRWKQTVEPLPGDLGWARISIPFFELEIGTWPVYCEGQMQGEDVLLRSLSSHFRGMSNQQPDHGPHFWFPLFRPIQSWRGMRVDQDQRFLPGKYLPREIPNAHVEIDWRSNEAGELSVSREQLRYSQSAAQAVAWLRNRIEELQRQSDNETRDFDLFFSVSPDYPREKVFAANRDIESPQWLSVVTGEQDRAHWGLPDLPAVYFSKPPTRKELGHSVLLGDEPLSELLSVHIRGETGKPGSETYNLSIPPYHVAGPISQRKHAAPDIIAVARHRKLKHSTEPYISPVLIWKRPPQVSDPSSALASKFPPAWADVAAVVFKGSHSAGEPMVLIWNREHPLWVGAPNIASIIEFEYRRFAHDSEKSLVANQEAIASRDGAAGWLARWLVALIHKSYFDHRNNELASLFASPAFQEFHAKAWKVLFDDAAWSGGPEILCYDFADRSRLTLTPQSSYRAVEGLEGSAIVFKDPGPEWTVERVG